MNANAQLEAAALTGERTQHVGPMADAGQTLRSDRRQGAEGTERIVGTSDALRRVMDQVQLVAPTEASVLILGDSGTGKELLASAIHQQSLRRHRPMGRVNCGAIPRELFESEFFGHVKGAFTGALKERVGRFEAVDGGTLFLDEVTEIPLDLQAKLLRVLQEGEFERVGDERIRKVDVRIIAATNRDLLAEVKAGRFREDLYFRLNVIPLLMPPLRERLDDIPQLAAHIVRQISHRLGCPEATLTSDHIRTLQRYPWPGNIRELRNVIERSIILSRGRALCLELVCETLHGAEQSREEQRLGGVSTESDRKQYARRNIVGALQRAGGKIYGPHGAAALLGVKPTTLASRIKVLGIRKSDYGNRATAPELPAFPENAWA